MGASPSSLDTAAMEEAYKAHPRLSIVITGGTSGIGEGIAVTLAKLVAEPYIIIIGRSQASADRVLARLQEINAKGKYQFIACDLTLMKNAGEAARELQARMPHINLLVLSSGFLRLDGKRVETTEGIDESMAVQFYSRFFLTRRLMPCLEAAAAAGEPAHAMFILNSGKAMKLPPADDLDLRKGYGALSAALTLMTYTDLMTEELSIRHPKVTFSHAYPGVVDTNISSGLPWWGKAGFATTKPFQITAEVCGVRMCRALAYEGFKQGGWHFFDQYGDLAKPSKHQTPEARQLVWEHATKLTTDAAASSSSSASSGQQL